MDTKISDFTANEQINNVRTASSIEETTAGSGIAMSRNIIDIIKEVMYPFSLKNIRYETQLEETIAYILTILRTLIGIVAIIEIFMLVKNKKTT